MLISCATQSAIVLEKRSGLIHEHSTKKPTVLYAYEVASPDTFWIQSETEYFVGDTIQILKR